MEPTVLVLGNANVDLTTYVNSMPEDGETVLGTDFSIGMGGKGSNQAVACSRAGSPTAFIGSIGTDTFGDYSFDTLNSENLELSLLARSDSPTGVATITVNEGGANRIAVFLGASGDIDPSTLNTALQRWASLRFFVSQLELPIDLVESSLHAAREAGLTTVLNTAPYQQLSREIFASTDWLIGNEVEMASLLADSGVNADLTLPVESLLTQIPRWSELLNTHLVLTLGEKGAIGCERSGTPFHAASPSVSAVDTVGAGDCFVGYFVGFLDQHYTWEEAMVAAVSAASRSVTSRGAQQSYPHASELDAIRQAARARTPK